ncbi:hypothetical protein [Haloplasma contractile]|uniref:Membrane lipoprotein n=1 Tax=Haloplasma contractile SSD-17B TaxID=1033810 RepID=U2EEN1_9MOLU|nr:hypothetical protein [Haloplasma contractile]ERJ13156.1 membrane lipoprotein [Haloplasma contractile SSD-17B]
MKQLERLNTIGEELSRIDDALALLALGSVGCELDRMDQYSDLDFFVICKEGTKNRFLNHLNWLENIHPLVFTFRNTKDGYKALYEDNIFCEFAIFEPQELENIEFSRGRIVWKREEFDASLCDGTMTEYKKKENIDFFINEALTNLYIGLGRYHRGENLSAYYFIQVYAFDRILHLMTTIEQPTDSKGDLFVLNRRFEQRYPESSKTISNLLLGYDEIVKGAKNCLEFLDEQFAINQGIKSRIEALISEGEINE